MTTLLLWGFAIIMTLIQLSSIKLVAQEHGTGSTEHLAYKKKVHRMLSVCYGSTALIMIIALFI